MTKDDVMRSFESEFEFTPTPAYNIYYDLNSIQTVKERLGKWKIEVSLQYKNMSSHIHSPSFVFTQYVLVLMPNQKMIENYSNKIIDDAMISAVTGLVRYWPLKSVCINQQSINNKSLENFLSNFFTNRTNKSIVVCQTEAKWSSLYPDPKSDVLNYGLKMENRLIIN